MCDEEDNINVIADEGCDSNDPTVARRCSYLCLCAIIRQVLLRENQRKVVIRHESLLILVCIQSK